MATAKNRTTIYSYARVGVTVSSLATLEPAIALLPVELRRSRDASHHRTWPQVETNSGMVPLRSFEKRFTGKL